MSYSIIQNAVRITERKKVTHLISTHRHHYNVYTFENGSTYAVDGGTDYIKRGLSSKEYPSDCLIENYNLSKDFEFSVIADKLLWGTRGTSGKEPLVYRPFKDLSLKHLNAILTFSQYVTPLSGLQLEVINFWIKQKSSV